MDASNLSRLKPVFERVFGPLDPDLALALVERLVPRQVSRGAALYRRGDRADALHLVLTGRLEVRVAGPEGRPQRLAMLVPGDTVGEMGLFTGGERTADVIALRESTLGELSRADFESLLGRDPRFLAASARFIVHRLAQSQARSGQASENRRQTVALMPMRSGIPIDEFTRRLDLALLRHGRTRRLDEHAVRSRFPEAFRSGVSEGDEVAVGRFLDELEGNTEFLLLQGDARPGDWNERIVGYADRVLLIGEGPPSGSTRWIEERLAAAESSGVRPAVELALLHQDSSRLPEHTAEWLRSIEVDRHYHVPWRGNAGINRLARLLAGRAVTVVLGGGGARGLAHVGVVRALREAGIPIDAVGGTSFGGVVAAMVALGFPDARIYDEFKVGFSDNHPMNDYTVPVVSLLRGGKLVTALQRAYGDARIEDMWLPYFAVSASLSRNRMRVHDRGEVWRAVRATVSLPGILPPFIDDGELLVDGAILNNLPVEVMRERIRGRSIAVDLSVDDEYHLERDAMPSGWEMLRGQLLRDGQRTAVPTLHEVIVMATTLASRREVEVARREADLYLNPPVGEFGLLDWNRFHDIVEVGYRYAIERAEAWAADHRDSARRDEYFDSRSRGAA